MDDPAPLPAPVDEGAGSATPGEQTAPDATSAPVSARQRRRKRDDAKSQARRIRRERKRWFSAFRATIGASVALLALFLFANVSLGTMFAAPKIDAAFFLLYTAMAAVAAVLAMRRYRRTKGLFEAQRTIPWEDIAFMAFLGLATLTTFTHHGGYHFIAWSLETKTPGAFVRSRMVHFLALSALLAPLFFLVRSRRWLDWVMPALFLGAELLCAKALFDLTGGAAVYSDDHPSFLFRIQEFWHSFPWRENYVPHWNAGVVNSVISSSGVPGYALLTFPLRLLSPLPHETHSAGLFLTQAVIVPWTVVWAFRANRLSWRAAWSGALLALFANRAFFLWAFHFGTVGFGVSMAMVPSAFLFLYAVAEKRFVTASTVLGLVFSMTFLCQWPPMWMVAASMALAALTSCGRWLRDARALVALLLAALATLALLFPTLRAVVCGKSLIDYTTAAPKHSLDGLRILASLRLLLGDIAFRVHPATLVLGLGGLWTMQEKPLRRWLVVATLCIAAIASVGGERVPRMQLPRVIVAAGMLAIVPAAIRIGHIWRDHHAATILLQSGLLALFLVGVPNVAKLYNGAGYAPFRPMPGLVANLADWVRANVPEDSRLLFAGRTIHRYGRGHVAYLPILAGREMMACDYYDFPPGLYEPAYPPRSSRREPGGSHAFMVRHGVSHVIAYRPNYIDWLRSEPDHFEELPEFTEEAWGPFRVFRVKGAHGVFLEGSGRVEADFNRIRVDFGASPPDRAVIAYNWNDRLAVADGPAEIAPFDTGTSLGRDARNEVIPVRFIEIHPNGANTVTIRYRPRF